MLLDIETRIGELADREEKSLPVSIGGKAGWKPSGQPLKHERLGLPEKRMQQSQAIAKHPEIVEKVKAQARENEDIPTRTAVINEIKYQKEKERRAEADANRTEMIKGFDQLKMTEEQRKRTLKDGQEAGEMLLDIEAKIGELLPSAEEAQRGAIKQKGIPKSERLSGHIKVLPDGINGKRATQARAIVAHPEIVEKVKAQAREKGLCLL